MTIKQLSDTDLAKAHGGFGWQDALSIAVPGYGAARFGAKIGAAAATGKMDLNAVVDNGNRYGGAGALIGAGGGAAIGSVGGPPGAATGAGIGGAALGAAGWVGGAAYEANRQATQILGR